MKSLKFAFGIAVLLTGATCFSQPGKDGMKPPPIQERIKMVDKEICQPLKLGKAENEKVIAAFNEFFTEMDKIAAPPARPEKQKADALAETRDKKVKLASPGMKYSKYLELEKSIRPKGPEEGRSRPN